MNRHEIAVLTAGKTGFSIKDCERILVSAQEVASEALKTGDDVSIRGFGTFRTAFTARRKLRHPATGEAVEAEPVKTIRFHPTEQLKEKIK